MGSQAPSGSDGWSSDYLSLRHEILASIEKQDRWFLFVVSVFGLMATLSGASTNDPIRGSLLWLALLIVITIMQAKVLQFRDTVHRAGSYLCIQEQDVFAGYRWEHDFRQFLGKYEYASSNAKQPKSPKDRRKLQIFEASTKVRDYAFSFMAFLTFVFLVMEVQGLQSFLHQVSSVAIGLLFLVASFAFSYCSHKDKWKQEFYLSIWKEDGVITREDPTDNERSQ